MCEKKAVPDLTGTLVAKVLEGQRACNLGRGTGEEDMGVCQAAVRNCSFVEGSGSRLRGWEPCSTVGHPGAGTWGSALRRMLMWEAGRAASSGRQKGQTDYSSEEEWSVCA